MASKYYKMYDFISVGEFHFVQFIKYCTILIFNI